MAIKVQDRIDRRRKTKFDDSCTDNSCIIWIAAIFKDKLPEYVAENTPKKWISKLDEVLEYFDNKTQEEIRLECHNSKKVIALFCEYEFNWVDDPKKFIQDQVNGQNIAAWLYRNGNNKNLVYASSWNKID